MSDIFTKNTSQRGNAAIVALFGLVILAIGAGVYINKDSIFKDDASEALAEETADVAETSPAKPVEKIAESDPVAQAEPASGEANSEIEKSEAAEFKIEEGNPTVAKVGSEEIKRSDVLAFIQNLPPNMQKLPANQLFPLATVQVVNAKVIGEKAGKAKLDNDPVVKEQLSAVKDQIVRNVFLQKQVASKLSEERLKSAYEDYKKSFPEIQEVKARHILVKEESEAKDILKKLKDGGDFAALAKEHSLDGTKENGGELSYVAKQEVVPEFADAAFAMEKGEMTKKPVKTDFGYHIIEVQDKRQRPVPTYEESKPFLESQLRNVVLEEMLGEWRKAANVEVYDINGKPFAGNEAVKTN
ncbi:MAG: peptidylprolyl isomerase [Micavibrio sp.]|nr:peptidylprolyl isomerase [Micavibrio sp.]